LLESKPYAEADLMRKDVAVFFEMLAEAEAAARQRAAKQTLIQP
jgi:hypothetical protein